MKFKTVSLINSFEGLSNEEKFQKYRILWHEAKQYRVLTDFPMHLDVELAGVCNLKCSSCFQNGLLEGPLGLMNLSLFHQIIEEGVPKGLCALKLQIRGESLLHPKIFELIRFAKDSGVLDVQLTTNGTLMTQEKIEKLLNSGLDGIIFSVDAHHDSSIQERYTKKIVGSVETAVQDFLNARKNKKNPRIPWVRLRSSIPQMNEMTHKKTKEYLREKFPQADIFIVDRIFSFKDDQDCYPNLRENYILEPCEYLMQRLAIFWNGEVTACCMDYNNRFQLGNLTSQSIQEIWLSNKMEALRKAHLNGQRNHTPICLHCNKCVRPKNEKNFVDTTPRHLADYAKTNP